MALKHPEIEGGSGYAAASFGDMGYEPTLSAEGGAKPKNQGRRKEKVWLLLVWVLDGLLPEWLLLVRLVEISEAKRKGVLYLCYET